MNKHIETIGLCAFGNNVLHVGENYLSLVHSDNSGIKICAPMIKIDFI